MRNAILFHLREWKMSIQIMILCDINCDEWWARGATDVKSPSLTFPLAQKNEKLII